MNAHTPNENNLSAPRLAEIDTPCRQQESTRFLNQLIGECFNPVGPFMSNETNAAAIRHAPSRNGASSLEKCFEQAEIGVHNRAILQQNLLLSLNAILASTSAGCGIAYR